MAELINGTRNGTVGPTALTELLSTGLRPTGPTESAGARAVAAQPAGPAGTAGVSGLPGALPVSWEVIQDLRRQVSDDVQATKKKLQSDGRVLTRADEEQLGREVVTQRIAQWASLWSAEHGLLGREGEAAVREAVFDALFRAGAVQRYLDRDGVENVIIDGTGAVVDYFDRPAERLEGLFDSHAAVERWVNEMAERSGAGERQLSKARPTTNFRLPDGSRVAATLMTTRPTVAIRKHRIVDHGLEQLLGWGTIDTVLDAFLRACVRGRQNILIAGDMGAGKTSLLRALGRVIPAHERVATLESDRELYLDHMPGGPHVLAFEARESGGERGTDGQLQGAVTIADMVPETLRYSASRVMVGEVRSVEAVPMLEVMSAGGSGSMCTIHARRPEDVVERLVLLCTQAGLSAESAYRLIASAVDIVVYLRYVNETAIGGRKWRFVSHVHEITGASETGRPAMTEVFGPVPGEARAVVKNPLQTETLAQLEREGGFDRRWLQVERGQWGPMTTRMPL